MKNNKFKQALKTILVSMILFCLFSDSQAQSDPISRKDTMYMITTNDGGEFVGKIISDDSREVVIIDRTKGKLILPKYSIKLMEMVKQSNLVGNMIVHANPHPSRYLFTPSAIALKRGEGYMNWFYFLIFQMQYGITDNFSMGITTSWILSPTMINLKYTVPVSDELCFAIGGQIGKLTIWDDNSVALGFASSTIGTAESNVSLNVGYGSYMRDGITIATLSGVQRISENASIMGEFWYCQPNNGTPFFMGGPAFRIYSGRKSTYDIALLAIGNKSFQLWPLPLLSISYKI